jgi:FkbM family methyltransferase
MGRLAVVAKTWIQRLLNRTGYRIERLIQSSQPIDVFDLAVRKSAAERGDRFFFVQIGAYDGRTLDPIYRYVKEYHWAGLLVEPQPAVFECLKVTYAGEPQLTLVNAAVSREDGTATLYTVATDGPPTEAQVMASFDRGLLVRQLPTGTPVVALTVPAFTLATLFRAHGVRAIDLLQIDAEGFDYEVVKMIDFAVVRPTVIHYEHRHLSDADRVACERLLTAQGYRLAVSGIDTTALIQG